jgi:ferredoxin
MKKALFLLFALISTGFMTNLVMGQSQQDSTPVLKIYYFHATNRCPSCTACEEVCKETLQKHFQKEIDNGTILFQAVNIEEEKNKSLVEQYKIMFSTLLFITQNGAVIDLSDKAFEYSIDYPQKYEDFLKYEVLKYLMK